MKDSADRLWTKNITESSVVRWGKGKKNDKLFSVLFAIFFLSQQSGEFISRPLPYVCAYRTGPMSKSTGHLEN